MIVYVDTSSLLKLLVDEDGSDRVQAVWDAAEELASSTLVVVEARAALAAAERRARLTPRQHRTAKDWLSLLVDEISIIEVTENLIAEASNLAEQEALPGYDALHLASALVMEADVLTSADEALCDAAARRGLHVANPLGA